MRAVILAAGRGSRMGSDTDDKPKCFTTLCGNRLLEWQINGLRDAGIDEVIVVRGYKGQMLSGDFLTIDNPQWETSNMATSLTMASQWLDDAPAIVSYSDIVYHPDHVRALMACDGALGIAADRRWLDLWNLRFEEPLEDAENFREADGKLLEIGGQPECLEKIMGQYMGLLRFTPEGWRAMHHLYLDLSRQEQADLDMTAWLALALEQGIEIQIRYVDGRWCEIDSTSDLRRYEHEILRLENTGETWLHDWRWN